MELMESLEYARAYIDDLLCISRNSLEDHLEKKLEEVLRRLRDADLKVNADNRHSVHLKNAWGTYLVKTKLNLRAIRRRQYSRFNRPKEWNN
jgi:hypothetical protein